MHVKTWKLLQKLELFSSEMKKQHLSAWSYAKFSLPEAAEWWDKEHTIASAEVGFESLRDSGIRRLTFLAFRVRGTL
jgi:hypothetical protein